MFKAQPFFILSNPRSGSSLLRVICDSHRLISVPPECGFTEWLYEKYKDWKFEDNTNRITYFCDDLESSRKFETWNFDFCLFNEVVREHMPKNYSDLAALVHISYGLQKGKNIQVWGDKNNYFTHKVDLIRKLYPCSKYIHIIRDGRDVATSYRELKDLKSTSSYVPNLPTDIKEIAEEWKKNNQLVLSFLRTVDPERVFFLRYEDLIYNLEQKCRMICDFLKISFDEEMLTYYEKNLREGLEPKETLEWKRKTLQRPDKLAVGKYKKVLTKWEISDFNSVAIQTLKRFGYGY